ncbi:MAG: citrate synthase [Eubacteriales bacterium]
MDHNFLAQTYGKSSNFTGIENHLYKEYNVKKGLRNEDGGGVCVGLTKICDVVGFSLDEEEHRQPAEGQLFYRGYNLEDLVRGKSINASGFEEIFFLLLFGFLPRRSELDDFKSTLQNCYELPDRFSELNFLTFPSRNLMNLLQCAVLSLYNFDPNPESPNIFDVMKQGINIVANMPTMICYGYQSQQHYLHKKSLVIHYPMPEYSLAENILYMLRDDMQFTEKEANTLDTLLMVQAEHGGGNNSTFTNVVISSTGTDIYSAFAGSIGSMKGPKHGGANVSCANMIDAIIEEIGLEATERQMESIVNRILDRKFFDKTGLFYGVGHAVYTLSDPRSELIRTTCKELAIEKDCMLEYDFMTRLEKVARRVVSERLGKPISNNVDYYSGFVYKMLGIPREVYTPLFVCARTTGWLAHNIENRLYDGKIMRPATKCVSERKEYTKIKNR